ncbi:MAG: hypothetical protein ACXWRE_03990 [Pseudobdellovibrionaceae bacterium]
MSNINPLFLDSTKPIGDKVVTNVELFNILLHDGDFLYFEMINQFGFVQRFLMQAIETKKSIKYKTEVWLNYQHQIQYRFVIEAEGQELYASEKRETRAGHIISEKWEPCLNSGILEKKIEKRNARRPAGMGERKSPSSKPLCQPQFLEQIKSLLDDLL